jgi:solute carrier family 1 (high affinity glutamate transporter) protein 2
MINKVERRLQSELGTNIIGMMMFSLIVGIVVGKMDNEKVVVINIFNTLNKIIMKIVSLLLLLMPITILSLMIGKIMVIKDLDLVAKQLAMFVLTVNIGLLMHGFIILPLIYYIITKQNPFTFIRGFIET